MRKGTIVSTVWLVVALTLGAGPAAAGDTLYVVVNAANPVRELTQRDVVALYTGRTRAFPNDQPALPVDFPRDSESRRQFYRQLTGQDLAMINSYWARLLFAGHMQPPRSVADDRAMRSLLRQDPTAVGYLPYKPDDPALRVVFTLQGEAGAK
jgi:hypothetical protein